MAGRVRAFRASGPRVGRPNGGERAYPCRPWGVTCDARGVGPVIGGVLLFALGVGWFALSHVVMGNPAPDAVVEALGVVLAVLIVVSIVGAVLRSKGSHG